MKAVFELMERFTVMSMIGFFGRSLLPKGSVGSSGKRALSLVLLLLAAETVAMMLFGMG